MFSLLKRKKQHPVSKQNKTGNVFSHVFKIYQKKINLKLFLSLLAIDRRATTQDATDDVMLNKCLQSVPLHHCISWHLSIAIDQQSQKEILVNICPEMADLGALSLELFRQEDESDGKCSGNSYNRRAFRAYQWVKMIVCGRLIRRTYHSRSDLAKGTCSFPYPYPKGKPCLETPGFC